MTQTTKYALPTHSICLYPSLLQTIISVLLEPNSLYPFHIVYAYN